MTIDQPLEDDGIKKLTIDNWLEGDKILRAFVRLDAHGRRSPLTQELLAERFLSVEISADVPQEIQTLFRTARGVLLYGYFFYPLYVVGLGELSRTAEAAVGHRFKDLAGPRSRRTFKRRLEWLHSNGHLSDRELFIWEGLRESRNATARPTYQMVEPPGDLAQELRVVAHCIDCLFDRTLDFASLWRPLVSSPTQVESVAD